MLFLKRNKSIYYIKNHLYYYFPTRFFVRKQKESLLYYKKSKEKTYIDNRVNYYNKLENTFFTDASFETIGHFYKTHKKKTYFFDIIGYLRAYDFKNKIKYVFGDVTTVPKKPSFVKSRPIDGDTINSVILKLNKVRHYLFVNDTKKFSDKKDKLVWRGDSGGRPHRINFVKKLWDHPLCDVGQTQKSVQDVPWQKPKLSITQQLDYKFIFCIEGNDVATSLKWAMSSNSLVFSFKMKYETWYMEGKLKPGKHFVLIKDDLSDLEEKINYYIQNPNAAQKIIDNAQQWVAQFKNKKREDAISVLVMQKYFDYLREEE